MPDLSISECLSVFCLPYCGMEGVSCYQQFPHTAQGLSQNCSCLIFPACGTLRDSFSKYRFATSANWPNMAGPIFIGIMFSLLISLNNSDSSEFGVCLLVLSRQVTHISWLPPPFCSVSSLSSLYWERFLCSSSIPDCETLSEGPGKGYRLPC